VSPNGAETQPDIAGAGTAGPLRPAASARRCLSGARAAPGTAGLNAGRAAPQRVLV
jgi:hypothetical protein